MKVQEVPTRPTLRPEPGATPERGFEPVPDRGPTPVSTTVDELGDRIARLSAEIQAATYHLLTMIREFDERSGWGSGFRSCAHWLNWRTGLDLGAAREKVRVARALAELPLFSEAMRRGQLSYSKVRALTRVATSKNEEQLLEYALDGTAAHVEKLVRAFRRVKRDEEVERENLRHESRHLQAYTADDGMVVLRGRLDPEVGEALLRALEAASEVLYDTERERKDATGDGVSATQRRADAIGLVAESALNGELAGGMRQSGSLEGTEEETGEGPARTSGAPSYSGTVRGTRADRYQVVVHVDAGVLADPDQPGISTLGDALDVSAETSRRLACDASKVVMTHDASGKILDVGRRTRTISPALRRALDHRDKGCRFPGCEVMFCDAHHVKHWAEGGATSLENTVLLCRKHHRCVHEEQFNVRLQSDGEIRFYRPDGRLIPPAPMLPGASPQPLQAFTRRLAGKGLTIDEATGAPTWDGGRIDWGAAIDGLLAAEC